MWPFPLEGGKRSLFYVSRVYLETAVYSVGIKSLCFDLDLPRGIFGWGNHNFCFFCAEVCHLVAKGALDFSWYLLLLCKGKMSWSWDPLCSGIFLAFCLHLMPVAATWLGRLPHSPGVSYQSFCFAKLSNSCWLWQIILWDYLCLSPLNGEICEFSDVTV